MKFNLNPDPDTLSSFLRQAGYAPEGQDPRTGELRFTRSLTGRRYPRFHLYCHEETNSCNLHLDQKQPSYQGNSAHSGEYEGTLVELEAERIVSKQKTP